MKRKFKIGDRVRCKPGFTAFSGGGGGAGYIAEKIFVIDSINSNGTFESTCAFEEGAGQGVYFRALELVKQELYEIY